MSTAPLGTLPGVEPGELTITPGSTAQDALTEQPVVPDKSEPTLEPKVAESRPLPAVDSSSTMPQPVEPVLPRRTESPAVAESPTHSPAQTPASAVPRNPTVSLPGSLPGPEKIAPQLPAMSEPRLASVPPKLPLPQGKPEAEPAVERAQINRTELAAKILGGNMALRTCEEELDKDQTWTSAELSPLVDRLKLLVIQRYDCQLLYAVLPESEQTLVGTFEPAQPVFRALRSRIVDARRYALGGGFPGTEAERTAELRALDELARSLSDLVAARR